MSTYTNLKIELLNVGDTGWGPTTNNNFQYALEQAMINSADVTFASADVTLTLTNSNLSQTARNLRLVCTGTTGGTARNLILGSGCQFAKPFIVYNSCADAITVKNTSNSGISVPALRTMLLYNNGVDVVDAINYVSTLAIGAALPVTSGGTGVTTSTGTGANVLSTTPTLVTPVLGVATATSVNKVAFTAPATSATLTIADGKTLTASNTLTLAGTDSTTMTFPASNASLASLGIAQTFTATQTLNGSATTLAEVIKNAAEPITVSATAATGTINYNLLTQSVVYYTTAASANWTINLRGDGTTSMNTLLSTGQAATMVFMATQTSPAYYNNVVQVDGTTSGVTTKWLNGTPTIGNINAVDVYTYTVVKTGSAAFTVFASQALFS
jgi:hypothetical protein